MLQIRKVASYYFNEVIKIGGTITGEHGDGLARSEFVESVYGQKNFNVFLKTKRLFDKKNILNPNKVISKKNTMLKHIQL